MEITQEPIDVELESNSIGIQTSEIEDVCIENNTDLEVSVAKKEFVITGDDIYISGSGQTTPQWIVDAINQEVASKVAAKTTELNEAIAAINQSLLELELAKNTYTESIITEETINGIVVSHLDTLNATVQGNSANIVNLETTKATPDEALTLSINHLNSQIQDGEIHSLVTDLSTTIATNKETAAADNTTLTSVFNSNMSSIDQEFATHADDISTNATAITNLRSDLYDSETGDLAGTSGYLSEVKTFVGYDEEGQTIPTQLLGLSDTIQENITDISALQNQVDGEVMIHAHNWGPVTIAEPITDTQPLYNVLGVDKDLAEMSEVYGSFKAVVYTTTTAPTSISTDHYTLSMNLHGLDRYGYLNGNYTAGTECVMKIYVDGGLDEFDQTIWHLGYVGEPITLPSDKSLEVNFGDVNPSNFVASTVPLADKEPYKTWYETDLANGNDYERSVHTGDSFIYVNVNGEYVRSFKFVKSEVNGTDADGYAWYEIKDSAAMVAATTAYALADGKMTVFTTTPSGPYQIGDLWVKTLGSGTDGYYEEIWKCIADRYTGYNASDWKLAATDNQYAKDIEAGTRQITLGDHLNDLGWQTKTEVADVAGSTLGTWVSETYDQDQVSVGIAIDKKVTTYFEATEPYDPTLAAEYQDGDLWYDTTAKILSRYSYIGQAWEVIEDQVAIDAAQAAAGAQSTADGKIETFFMDTAPTSGSLGDIWVDTNDNKHMYRYDGRDPYSIEGWISIRDTKNDAALSNAVQDILGLEETNDGVVESFYSSIAPATGMSYGDWWVDTSSDPVTAAYRYEDVNGKNVDTLSWVNQSDHIVGKAFIGAAGAQSTADGKITTFYQNAAPTSEGKGDLWIDLDDNNKMYRSTGTGATSVEGTDPTWVPVSDESVLDTFLVTTYATDLLNTRNQLDGVAITYFQDTVPYQPETGVVENSGDVWYDISTYRAYQFKYEVLAINGSVESESTWAEILNTDILNALLAASKTKAAADRSIKNYTDEPTVPYYIGDTWMQGSTGEIYVCGNAKDENGVFAQDDWILASKYTDDSAVTLLSNGLINGTVAVDLSQATIDGVTPLDTFVADQIDEQVVVFSGTDHTTQTGMKTDDIYIEKTTETGTSGVVVDVLNTYKYNGTSWDVIGNNNNLTGLADLADGKRTIYAGIAIPSGEDRDIWIPEDGAVSPYIVGEVYQYLNDSWELATTYSSNLDTYKGIVSGLLDDINIGIDSKVEYWFQVSTTDPKDSWTDQETRDKHNNDVWYQTDSHTSWYYVALRDIWEPIRDQKALDAIEDAADAQETANGKLTVYRTETDPNDGVNIMHDGDMWVHTVGTDVITSIWDINTGSWDDNWQSEKVVALAEKIEKLDAYVTPGDWTQVLDPNSITDGVYDYLDCTSICGTEKGYGVPVEDINDVAPPRPMTNVIAEMGGWIPTYEADPISAEGIPGVIGAISTLENSIKTTEDSVESMLKYEVDTTVNGKTYTSGFGLATIGTQDGTPEDPYESEFWINADKFKFVNETNGIISAPECSPFSIDATDPNNPQTTFTGKVRFTSGCGGTETDAEEYITGIAKNVVGTSNLIPFNNTAGVAEDYDYEAGTVENRVESAIGDNSQNYYTTDSIGMYSPYIEGVGSSYNYEFVFTGSTVVPGKVIEIETDIVGNNSEPVVVYNEESPGIDYTIEADKGYKVTGQVHSFGSEASTSGKVVRLSDGVEIATIGDRILAEATTRFVLGFETVGAIIGAIGIRLVDPDTAAYIGDNYTTSADIAEALATDTTVIDGSRIITGSVDASKINVQDLYVTRVYPGNNGVGFEISALKAAGPVDDKNYHIYGADIYGSRISGGIIESTYLQNAIAFDTFTTYTGCPDYPDGMPVVNHIESSTLSTSVNHLCESWNTSIMVANYSSNVFGYSNCSDSVYKTKDFNTALNFTENMGLQPYGADGIIPGTENYVKLGSLVIRGASSEGPCSGLPRNLGYIGGPSEYLSDFALDFTICDQNITLTYADSIGTMVRIGGFDGEDTNWDVYKSNLYQYNGFSIIAIATIGFGGSIGRSDLMSTTSSFTYYACFDSPQFIPASTGSDDVVVFSITGQCKTEPATYYNDCGISLTAGVFPFSVDNS